jgi:hypothetical protein
MSLKDKKIYIKILFEKLISNIPQNVVNENRAYGNNYTQIYVQGK